MIKIDYFKPGIVGLFLNPHYHIRSGIYKSLTEKSIYIEGATLDFGCGSKPYEHLFFKNTEYIGVDIEITGHNHKNSKVDVYFDGINLPFENSKFQSVVCSEVLEHVFEPIEVLAEIHRVMKPDGYILLTVPFTFEEHEEPFDYARYSSFGVKYLLESNGFKIIQLNKINSPWTTIGTLITSYVYNLLPKAKILRHLVAIPLIGFTNIFFIILEFLLPKSENLYTNTIILAQKQ
ncbi:MAG: SAM-dependent methyltransferase [Spirosomataceae bacterium]|jgi:SAM-dependent methyltransferase